MRRFPRPKFPFRIMRWHIPLIACAIFLAIAAVLTVRSEREIRAVERRAYRDASARLEHGTWSSYLDTVSASGVCVIDANGDGRQDLFFPGLGDFNTDRALLVGLTDRDIGNRLYLNLRTDSEGLPVFEEVTDQAGVRNIGKLGVGCAVADYDNDGDEDVLVTNATKGVLMSAFGSPPIGYGERIFPPRELFHTDGTDGKYDFPKEGGATLFRNMGQRGTGVRFEDVTVQAGLMRGGNGTVAAWGDVDNDGYVDLFVGNYADWDFSGFNYHRFAGGYDVLYRNNRDGTFSDVTATAKVQGEPEFVYDYAGNKQFGWDPSIKDSKGRVVGDPAGNTFAVSFVHNGGLPDLIVASDVPGRIRYYRNLGGFRFQEESDEKGFGQAGAWMGIALGDMNHDGKEDVFGTNTGGPGGSRYRPRSETSTDMADVLNPPNKGYLYPALWLSEGDSFRSVAHETAVDWGSYKPSIRWYPPEVRKERNAAPQPQGLEEGEFGFGTVMFDYNNDGEEDLYWVGGLRRLGASIYSDALKPGRLLENLGGGKNFLDVADTVDARNVVRQDDPRTYESGRGAVVADMNEDGYEDIVITNMGGFDKFDPSLPGLSLGKTYLQLGLAKQYTPGKTFLFVSDGGPNHWLKLKLTGTTSNRSAVGATVSIRYRENGTMKQQSGAVHAGGSYASQSSLELLFGLGNAERIEEVVVHWPSGKRTILNDVGINKKLNLIEP